MAEFRQPKDIIYGDKVQRAIVTGVTSVYKAVATTLGSKGKNVGIELNWGPPRIIHDGVSVAKEVVLKDAFANMTAQHVIAAAQRTNNQAGDGTTTATILTYAMVTEGLKHVTAKVNPQVLRKGIEKAADIVAMELRNMAQPITTQAEIQQIATISVADMEMGKLISGAIERVGRHGVVTVQPGNSDKVVVEYKEGMEFPQGFLHQYMMTDPQKGEALLQGGGAERPYIVIVDDVLTNDVIWNKMIKPISEIDPTVSPQIIFIANDYEPDALATVVVNRVKANKHFVAVKSPEFGPHRTNFLHDIAAVTGATVIGGQGGIGMTAIGVEHFGRAKRVTVTRHSTLIIDGSGDKETLRKHIKGIETEMKVAASSKEPEFIKDKLEARKARLIGGVAVIGVGANSEAEMDERKERVYDAVNATQAAIELGVVPGGGVALLKASKALQSILDGRAVGPIPITPEERFGILIVKEALYYPIRKLVENAGGNSGYVLQTILESNKKNLGYNVNSESFEDMVKSGIIDPLKVTLSAFTNAVSTAVMLLTMDCMIAYTRDEQKKKEEDIEGIGPMA